MKIGRNDRCPCGSGKKYKHCCLRLDRANRSAPNQAPIREAAKQAKTWQADLVAFPVRIDSDPEARPANLFVTADGFVIYNEVLPRPSVEVDDMAAELHRGIFEAGAQVGGFPPKIEVREAEVAAALAQRIREAGSPIPVCAAPLPGVDQVVVALNREMGGPARAFTVSRPELWAGWGHSKEWIAEVFEASAAFYRARPWRHFDDFPPVVAVTPDHHLWYLSIMGSGGVEYGLSFYSDQDDPDRVLDGGPGGPKGRVLSLTFDSRGLLPKPMRREIERAGWQVASADAYPSLLTIGTPAGGLRRDDANDLLKVTATVGAWIEAIDHDPRVEAKPWRDDETGVELEVQGFKIFETSEE